MPAMTSTATAPWQRGPLPPNTWNWGGVVTVGDKGLGGFYYAEFFGDHAVIEGPNGDEVVKAEDVAWYNNAIGESPVGVGLAKNQPE